MKKLFPLLFFVSILLFSCVTMSDYNYSSIDRSIAAGDFYGAKTGIKKSHSHYGAKSEVLKNLDLALMDHYSLDFASSNKNFEEAELLIKKFYAKSVAQQVGAYLVNDLVMDYEGESFEDIYTNIFMALNYIALGDNNEAMVEIRKFDEKMKLLGMKYASQLSDTEKELGGAVPKKDLEFHNSALARYLSMLLYRADGDKGNANVDVKYIKSAFQNQKSLYPFSIPSCVSSADAVDVPKGKARLDVLAFSGLSPIKIEEVIRVCWTRDYYKIAMPVMKTRKSSVTRISLSAKNISTGAVATTNLETIESLENISVNTFEAKSGLIYGRALLRSISKVVSQAAFREAARQTEDRDAGLSLIFSLGELFSTVSAEATERADTRCCRYFPANASVAALTLDPGVYKVTTNFYSGSRLIDSKTKKIDVRENKLNFIEEILLR